MKHTPGPWMIERGANFVRVMDANEDSIFSLSHNDLIEGTSQTAKAIEQKCSHIVRAVNLHDDAMKALERCVAALRANGAPNCQAAKEARIVLAKATDSDGVF